MRRSKTLARLRAGKAAKICALGHFIPAYVQMAATAGYDAIWLDLEHREMNSREVQALLAYFHLADIDCWLRPPTLEKTRLYRYLEDGATGLMIPHVSTADRARELVAAVKFPPLGDRGLDGSGFDARFGEDDPQAYLDDANRETFLAVQIETPLAVENVEKIAAVEGVDGLFVGPGDLGMRLARCGGEGSVEEAIQHVAAAAARFGKAWGCPASSREEVALRYEQGGRLVAYGAEFSALRKMLARCGTELQELYDGSPVDEAGQ